jgi:hypothetical protein
MSDPALSGYASWASTVTSVRWSPAFKVVSNA